MSEWAAWGTSVGTLALAGVTLTAVRSSNRSARVAERSLLVGMRPVLACGRPQDPIEQVQFADGRVFEVGAGGALACREGDAIYLAIPLRNVGAGIAQLRAYHLEAASAQGAAEDERGVALHRRGDLAPEESLFTRQQRDLHVPAGDVGFWQAALRDPSSDLYASTDEAIQTGGRLTVDILYGDHDGGQPAIVRFVLLPTGNGRWRCDATRYWSPP
jgi:hypothetical protein